MLNTNSPGNIQIEKLLPSLVYIQTHLDDDLSLDHVADVSGLSPYHFHRLFRTTIGETLKQYSQRLRLERAAYQLNIRDDSILNVALNNGFRNHETFSRSFKGWFGVSPRQYRTSYGRYPESYHDSQSLNRLTAVYSLSAISVQSLSAIPVAFMRQLGPYRTVDTGQYERLQRWVDTHGLNTGGNLLIGVGHDAPGITPDAKLRFDVCVSVPEPFTAEGAVGFQELPASTYGTASYVGPFGPTMEQALRDLYHNLAQRSDLEMIGLPLMEIYRTTHINPDYELNHTDIYVPVTLNQ